MSSNRNRFPPPSHLIPIGMMIGVLLGGLLWLLCIPRPFTLDVGSAGDSRFLSGFYQPEYADEGAVFRWCQPDAAIRLYGVRPGAALLYLRIHHHDRDPDTIPSLRIQATNQKQSQGIGSLRIEPGWRLYRILLPPEATASPGFSTLQLKTTMAKPNQPDERNLAIPVDQVEVHPLATTQLSSMQWLVVFERWLLLLWGIAICSGVLWLLNRMLLPRASIIAMIRALLWQIVGLLLIIIFLLIKTPFVFAWAWAYWSSTRWQLLLITLIVPAVAILKIVASRWSRWSQSPRWPQSVPSGTTQGNRILWLVVGGLIIIAHAVMLFGGANGMGAWFILALPGGMLVLLLMRREERDPLALLFLMMSGAFTVAPLLLLVIQALPGAVPRWGLLLLCDGVSGVVGWHIIRSPSPPPSSQPVPFRPFWPMLLVLLIAAMMRFPFLGSAEFQGDEAQVVLMAAGVAFGEDDILMLHRKGPMEILLVAAPLVLTNHLNEWIARFPFAMAGMANVLGCYLLASRLFHSRAAGVGAAAILAVEGFFIGFSRIVQYQQIVILMSMAGIWCCWRFAEMASPNEPEGKSAWRYITLGSCFASVGFLAHYDAMFAFPVMGWLIIVGGMRWGWRGTAWVRGLWPALFGLALLFGFYIPYVLHEHFAKTLAYLTTMRIGNEHEPEAIRFSSNLGEYLRLASYYNTSYEVWTAVGVLGTGMIIWLIRWGWPRKAGWLFATVLLLGMGMLRWIPESLIMANRVDVAIVFFALPLGALLLALPLPLPLRAIVLWFAGAFLVESFVIANPNTHFYTMLPAAAILMGWALVWGWRWARARQWLWLFSPLLIWFVVLIGLALPYRFLLYLQQSPEYDRAYPAHRPDRYLTSYGDQRPRGGRFGFPHRDGWKVVGELYRLGILDGEYATNQKPIITSWYLRDIPYGFPDDPMPYFFSAKREKFALPHDGYQLFGWVEVDGERMLDLYRYMQEKPSELPRIYHLHDYRDSFDAQPVRPFTIPRALFVLEVPGHTIRSSDE